MVRVAGDSSGNYQIPGSYGSPKSERLKILSKYVNSEVMNTLIE
jgi:hypothetical protein